MSITKDQSPADQIFCAFCSYKKRQTTKQQLSFLARTSFLRRASGLHNLFRSNVPSCLEVLFQSKGGTCVLCPADHVDKIMSLNGTAQLTPVSAISPTALPYVDVP